MARNAFAIIHELKQGILKLQAALAPLSVFGGEMTISQGRGRRPGRPRKTGMAKPTVKRNRARKPASAKVRATRKLQGRYLAAVRPLTPAQRTQVKTVREKKGAVVAIAHAKRLAKKATR